MLTFIDRRACEPFRHVVADGVRFERVSTVRDAEGIALTVSFDDHRR